MQGTVPSISPSPVILLARPRELFKPRRRLGLVRGTFLRFNIAHLLTAQGFHDPMTPQMPPPSTGLPELTPHPARLIAYRWPTLPSRHAADALNRASDETKRDSTPHSGSL